MSETTGKQRPIFFSSYFLERGNQKATVLARNAERNATEGIPCTFVCVKNKIKDFFHVVAMQTKTHGKILERKEEKRNPPETAWNKTNLAFVCQENE